MGNYTLFVAKRIARVLREGFTGDEQREIRRLLDVIQGDPLPDELNKFILPWPPAVFYAYVTPQFWIVYHVVGSEITVYNVGRSKDYEPVPW